MKHVKGTAIGAGLLLSLLVCTSASALCGLCANGGCKAVDETADPTPTFTPVTYSTDTASTNPKYAGISNGVMSDGNGAGGASLGARALAQIDQGNFCRRNGRTQAVVDACLKATTR